MPDDYGITMKTLLLAEGKRDKGDNWVHDLWRVELKRGDQEMVVPEYRMGIGHRRTKNGCQLQRRGNYQVLWDPKRNKICTHSWCQSQGSNAVKPVPPTLYDVLCSLKADLTHEVFEEWALSLGYDPDSRSALNTYLACQAEEVEFRRLMGDQFNTLVEDEDYT